MSGNWSVESMRLSVFSPDAPTGTEADWKLLTGQDEAEIRQNVPGGKVYVGNFGLGRVNLGFGPGRVDVVIGKAPSSSPDEAALPTFAPWQSAVGEFEPLIANYLAKFSKPIIRIAFGAVVLSIAADEPSVNSLLQNFIPSVKIRAETEDFLYRVNLPAVSRVNGLALNRITSFGSMKLQSGTFKMDGSEASLVFRQQLFAARLELDHSTSAGNTVPFSANQLIPIWKELVGLARENVEVGEKL